MTSQIEVDFPIEKLNPLARREANAKRPIAMLHKWWARRLGCVFRTILLASLIPEEEWRQLNEELRPAGIDAWAALYYRAHPKANALIDRYLKDKVVLDPFMGGGTTIVEALRLGCKAIGIDVNPVAWFITKKSIEPVDLEKLDSAYEELSETVAPEILRFYRTPCPHGDHEADVMYVFWVRVVRCASCGRRTRLFKSFRLATKKGKDTVFCPRCYWVGQVDEGELSVICPDCGHAFTPREGYSKGGKFKCELCDHPDETVQWVRRTGKAPNYEMYAIEYYCPQHGRGYKSVEEFDRQLYREACKELEHEKASLPLPDAEVYEGVKTTELLNYGMRRFTDLFNPRQLLCLGRLLEAIQAIEDEATRELMVVTLSDVTDSNNMLCTYRTDGRSARMLGRHAFWPPDQPCEGNPWGTVRGAGTFRRFYRIARAGVSWVKRPYEPMPGKGERIHLDEQVQTRLSGTALDVVEGLQRAFIAARSAEDLAFIPSGSVDAVITDPPYYDNVQYGELSDFFYVWLREGLQRAYAEFNPRVVPKQAEIVVNHKTGKTENHFRQALSTSYKECCRVLRDEGCMVFTFHHEEARAWAVVLDAVLEAEFDIEAVWPIHSETRGGTHRTGIRFDTIIVCRKRLAEPEPAAWGVLKDKIVLAVREELERLLEDGVALSGEDVFVITMGKALSVYSRHYPKVMRDGDEVKLTEAIQDIERLVDQQIDAYFGMVVPPWLDVVSRVYLQHVARRSAVTRDSLVMASRTRGLDFEVLEKANYIKRARKSGLYEVLSPRKRMAWIEERLNEGEELSLIDRAHYLYTLYKAGRSMRSEVPRIYSDRLEEVCEALYRITRDTTYEAITEETRRLREQGLLRLRLS